MIENTEKGKERMTEDQERGKDCTLIYDISDYTMLNVLGKSILLVLRLAQEPY